MELRDGVQAFEHEPTTENMLVFIQKELSASFPAHIQLFSLKLWETRDSYAEWLQA
jgi:6-pyruvoyltetrahydropterin/6-carboxytetrahydropterin synthase